MKRLGKILVLAAVAMLAMGVWANSVLANTPIGSGTYQTFLAVRINPLSGFFDKKYAKAEDPVSQANPDYGKISTIRVRIFSGEEQIKVLEQTRDLELSKSRPRFEISSGIDLSKVEVHVQLVGVADEIVQTVKLTDKRTILSIFAAPTGSDPAIYQIQTRK